MHLFVVMEDWGRGVTDVVTETVMKESYIATVLLETLKGIHYLHTKGILHRDIKSDNILLDMSGRVKINGFRVCVNDEVRTPTMVGNSITGAPEVCESEAVRKRRWISWSLGIMAIEMNDGERLHDRGALRAPWLIAQNGQPAIAKEKMSPQFQDFIDKCLEVDVDTRWSATELLEHPYLRLRWIQSNWFRSSRPPNLFQQTWKPCPPRTLILKKQRNPNRTIVSMETMLVNPRRSNNDKKWNH